MADAGSTLVEALIALGLTLMVTASAASLLNPNHLAAQAQAEALDMHQRMRVSMDALTRDLSMATAVQAAGESAIAITLSTGGVPPTRETRSLYLDAAGCQLRQYDGASTDVPIADNVVGLRFEYFGDVAGAGDGPVALPPPVGPDLDKIRMIRATVRVQAALSAFRATGPAFAKPGVARDSRRALADLSASVRIASRNLGRGR